jgi:hypothetical protein
MTTLGKAGYHTFLEKLQNGVTLDFKKTLTGIFEPEK